MSWTRPSLDQLIKNAISRLKSDAGIDASTKYTVENVLTQINAELANGLYDYQEWILEQCHLLTSDDENIIKAWGYVFGVTRKSASNAAGSIICLGTESSSIAEGKELEYNGYKYVTTETASIESGSATVCAKASSAGSDYNLSGGVYLSFIAPVPGVNSIAEVVSMSGGDEIEDISDYKDRIIEVIRTPSSGGNNSDYEIWAKEVTSITRAFASPLELGKGTVTLRPLLDNKVIKSPENLCKYSEDFEQDVYTLNNLTVNQTTFSNEAFNNTFELQFLSETATISQEINTIDESNYNFKVDLAGKDANVVATLRILKVSDSSVIKESTFTILNNQWATFNLNAEVSDEDSIILQLEITANVYATKFHCHTVDDTTYIKTSDYQYIGDVILPSPSDLARVQEYIESDDIMPNTAFLYVVSPIMQNVDIVISDLNPDEDDIKDAIALELADLFYRESKPKGTIYASQIDEAISLANGEISHKLISPIANITLTNGFMPRLGKISYE